MAREKFGEFYQIVKLYSPKILRFNYYYQYFNIFAKLHFAKLMFLHFCQTFVLYSNNNNNTAISHTNTHVANGYSYHITIGTQ